MAVGCLLFVVLCSLSVGYLVELYVFGELGGLGGLPPDFFKIHLFLAYFFSGIFAIFDRFWLSFWLHFGIILASFLHHFVQASFGHRFCLFFSSFLELSNRGNAIIS